MRCFILIDDIQDISERGLACQVLTSRSWRFRKLGLVGEFRHMHTLNLDFSSSLTSFEEDCFNCMPNLMSLSMCETMVANLWSTVAALSKLPSLVELRFQYWQYCNDTGTSFTSSSGKSDGTADFSLLDRVPFIGESCYDTRELTDLDISVEDPLRNFYSFDEEVMSHDVQSMVEDSLDSMVEDSSDDSEIDLTNHHHRNWLLDVFPRWSLQMPLQSEVAFLL
ncbi:hypothetical protein L195_g025232 [Trifolium pratense]|uniref:DWD hypersensitive to UV-B 1 N-terminal domain-containing protein n=1 Tax=Trifolium pratense TaxID=57577 RepID=A0A2K3NFY1_TRIPR|nr:hypothetical protein L195_g025232 [Trifolium pratense]